MDSRLTKQNFLAIMFLHLLSGLVYWLAGGASVYFSSDYCSVEHTAVRLCFTFCCRLSRLCTVVVGM